MLFGGGVFRRFGILLAGLLAILGINAVVSSALPAAQDSATETEISIVQDGLETSDATSGPAVPGTDNSPNNGVVKNFDTVTVGVEASLNDADDTNFTTTVTLGTTASFTAVPGECRTAAVFPGTSPDSSLADTTGDGLNDTLICNHGDHTEGTKLYFEAAVQAVGNNLDALQVDAISGSDDPAGVDRPATPAVVEITAGFGIGINKTVVGLPEEDEINYTPVYEPASVHGREGKTVNWFIDLNYNAGSEFVQDNGDGTQSFTIEDTWVGTHSNNPAVEGDNANGNFADGIELRDLVTGDPNDLCSLVGSNGGTVTCTQPGGPGSPITIQVDNVPVNQQPLARVSLQMFFPYDVLFDAPFNATNTYNIDNTAELVGWGGTGTLTTSATGTVDPGPEVDNNDYTVNASRPGPFALYKTFDSIGTAKTGARAGAPGEIIETSLAITDNRTFTTSNAICDTLDTSVFEYAGSIPVGQKDGLFHGVPTFNTQTLNEFVGVTATVHQRANPSVVVTGPLAGVPTAERFGVQNATTDATVRVEFSDVDYSVTGDDHWNATCEDDLTGDGNSDWVADTALIGGDANVVRVRLSWDRDYPALVAEYQAVQATVPAAAAFPSPDRFWAIFSFDLMIRPDAPVGTLLPNAAATRDNDSADWLGNWGGTTTGVRASNGTTPTNSTYFNVEDDPASPLFSFNVTNADRVLVLAASMGISKSIVPADQGPVVAGDLVTFEIDPVTAGSNADTVTMTFVDTLPPQLTYDSDTCAAAYAAVGLTCTASVAANNRTVTFTVPGYQVGDPLPPFQVSGVVNDGTGSGTYTNAVTIASDFAAFTDDSHCSSAADPAECSDQVTANHRSTASFQVVASSGESVVKSDSQVVVEPQADWVTGLTYTNLGGSDIGPGFLIDVVAFNGDGLVGSSTERFNQPTENPGNANTETLTGDSEDRVDFVSISPAAGETFEYTLDDPATVDIRPCHPSNWPAGDVLGGGNALLDQICGLGLIDPATDVPTATSVGTGATDWTAAAGPDVTAVRAALPAFPAGAPARTLELVTNVDFSVEGDLLCNNFGLNSEILTLDIISNDVCVEVVAGSIGDYVWFDINGDGVQDASEAPIEGVVINLLDGNGDPVLDENGDPVTATTDANGLYLFENLPSGDYIIEVDTSTLPAGVVQTFDNDGGLDNMSATTLNGPATDPTLTDVDDDLDQDFGYEPPLGSIGDTVWLDLNGDGVEDPSESGIEGVTILLLDGNGDPVLDASGNPITAVTDANGEYLFEDLPLGDYVVQVDSSTLPPSVSQTFDFDGGLDGMSAVTIDFDNPDDRDQDFGYEPVGSIGDTVFLDLNGDGVEDPGEAGIEGVTVKLLDGNGDPVLDDAGNPITAVTDANGQYLFEDLPFGDYTVMVDTDTLPAGLEQTFDLDGLLDHMSSVTIDADNPDDRDQDFGYVPPAVFDLALDKVLATEGPISVGDTLVYTITVFNQGDADVSDVGVTDFTPDGLTLVPGLGWSEDSAGDAVLDVPVPAIPAGGAVELSISYTVDATASGDITNFAEISGFFDEFGNAASDVDSTPDGDGANDTIVDGVVDGTDGDEDDSDIAVFSLTAEESPTLALTGASTIWIASVGALAVVGGLLLRRRRNTVTV